MLKRLPVVVGCLGLMAATSMFADGKLNDQKSKAGYAIGVKIGEQLLISKDDLDLDALHMGMKDTFEGKQPRLSVDEAQKALMAYQESKQKREQERMELMALKNKSDGEAFLAKNAKVKGVKTLPSGLQYRVVKAGTGPKPKATDTVVTHYRGTLIDGKIFDSSYERGEPATFPVNGVIRGWTEALQLMKTGAKWQLFLPSELAYGQNGAGGMIGPNATLLFEVELLEIK